VHFCDSAIFPASGSAQAQDYCGKLIRFVSKKKGMREWPGDPGHSF
jgi:hypothetical protein